MRQWQEWQMSHPLKRLRTETKTEPHMYFLHHRGAKVCLEWDCIHAAGFSSYNALGVLCLGRLKQLSLFISPFSTWLIQCVFNMLWIVMCLTATSSLSDGSQWGRLSVNTEPLWMTMVESAAVTWVFLYSGQYSLLIEWEVSVIESIRSLALMLDYNVCMQVDLMQMNEWRCLSYSIKTQTSSFVK